MRRQDVAALALAIAGVTVTLTAAPAAAQSSGNRLLGADVSDWQGSLSQTNWNTIHNTGGKSFVFLRATRGGTTGTYNENTRTGTLSQRYDDLYFEQNIARSTAAGMFAGIYHFARPDVTTNTGTDEANHMLEVAGPWMKPGYLPPVLDLEAGQSERSGAALSQFAIDFSDRIFAVKGIRPAVYCSQNYANYITSSVPATYPTLWLARWPNQSNPGAIDVQNGDPPPSPPSANVYGVWNPSFPAIPSPQPWQFWQYASTGTVAGISGNVDLDVAQGGVEYLKDFLNPALWTNDNSGEWTTIANWNTNADPSGKGPAARLPGGNDTLILDRGSANPIITLSSGAQSIRKLYVREALNIAGGSLTVTYAPLAESTPISAQFSSTVSLSPGASFSAHTLQMDAGSTFTLNGGGVTLNTINLLRGATPAKIVMGGDVTFIGLAGTAGAVNDSGSGSTIGSIDLAGGTRKFIVNDGAAPVDLAVNVPINNGTLYKDGPGTMQLGSFNTLSGLVTVNRGILLVTAKGQLGTTGVVTNMTVVAPGSAGSGFGGTLQLSNDVGYNLPITLGGGGQNGVSLTPPGSPGALDNLSGNNTWSGAITLNGGGSIGTDPLENQIGARAGALTLSGIIQNGAGVTASWVKTGDGDVVVSGGSANTYAGLTRQFGGRLIIQKDGALGGAGSPITSDANTFQIAGSASTLAFRAPSGAAGFNYSTFEVVNTEGAGAPGFGQIDNLGGTNTFAGQIALAGMASIGVTSGSLEVRGGLYARGTTGTRTIAKLGPGTLILSGASGAGSGNPSVVPLSGSTFNVNAGGIELRGATAATNLLPGVSTWNVNAGGTLRSTSGTIDGASINVAAGGALLFDGGTMNLASLNLAGGNATVAPGGNKALRTRALSITAGGRADLGDNNLIVDYAGGGDGGASPIGSWNGSAYSGVSGLIQSGRNGGTGGRWSGGGLVTSQSNATVGFLTALGVAESADVLGISATQTAVWDGQTVNGTSVLVMYTYAGDANLDGKINVDDYGRIDFAAPLTVTSYFNGDFNYDGKINIDDYGIIDFNITIQGPPLSSAHPAAVVAIPEPSSLIVSMVLGVGLVRRRRRHG